MTSEIKPIKRIIPFVVLALFYVSLAIAKEEFLTFPKYSYGFKKPAGWEVRKATQEWCSLSLEVPSQDNSFPLFIQIKAADYSSSDLNVCSANLVPTIKQALLGNLVQVNDIKQSDSLLGSNAAKTVIFIGEGATDVKSETKTGKDAVTLSIDTVNTSVLVKLIFTVKDGVVYILEYGGREEEFKKYEKDFDSLVTSFVIDKKIGEQAKVSLDKFQNFMNTHPIRSNTKEKSK